MWNYREIDQYQFIQCDVKKYKIKITISNSFLRENELIDEFVSYLGQDAKVEIEYVNEIPLLNSGKRKKVMNLMSK
jgi:phenylacetate-CoA ligase